MRPRRVYETVVYATDYEAARAFYRDVLGLREVENGAFRLDDVVGSAEVVVFNSVYAAARELLVTDAVLVVKARVDHKEGESKLIALEVTAFEATPERREVRLKLDARQARAGIIRELAAVVRDFPGEAPVIVDLETSEGPRTLQFGSEYRVKPEPDFFAEVKALLGEAAVA